MNSQLQTLHLIISGKVQGVFYRASTQQQAQKLHVTGWVKNLSNGDVEVLATGTKDALQSLLEWCHIGPPAAHVDAIQVKWMDQQKELKNFVITR